MRLLVLITCVLLTSIALSGCAAWQTAETVTPISYSVSRERIPRTIGKLRRLALIPLYQPAPKICNGSGNGPALAPDQWYVGPALTSLQDKGYEIVLLKEIIDAHTRNQLLNPSFLESIGKWSIQTQGPLDPSLGNAISSFGKQNNFDGLLILQMEETCPFANQAFRTLLGISTLGLSEFLPNPSLQQIHYEIWATIIEVSGARPVWRSHVLPELIDWWQDGPFATERRSATDSLFEDLEAAIPKILTR